MATSPSPQKKSTFRSRVGGVMRRSSTAFSIPGLPNRSGSATPPPDSDTASVTGSVAGKLDRKGSSGSLKQIDTAPAPTNSSTPSPIPESPAREAAALAAEPAPAKGPSPLAGQVTTAETASRGPTPPQSTPSTPPPPEPAVFNAAPQPPALDEQTKEKPEIAQVLTAEPEELPNVQPTSYVPPSAPASKPSTPPPPVSSPPTAPATPPPQPVSSGSYFGDIPRSTTPAGLESDPDGNVWADHSRARDASGSDARLPQDREITHKQSQTSTRGVSSSVAAPPLPQSRTVSAKSRASQPRQTELAGTTYTWSSSSDLGLGQSKTSLVQDDPFADPRPGNNNLAAAPAQEVPKASPADTIHVPEDFDPRSPRDDSLLPAPEPVTMPLPPIYQVIRPGISRQASSAFFGRTNSNDVDNYARNTSINERRPLISRPSTPAIITNFPPPSAASQIAQTYRASNPPVSQPVPQWAQPARFDVNGSAQNYSYGSISRPYTARGWIEFSLPHGLRYFTNRESRATTDVDLRNLAKLDEVTLAIDNVGGVPEGCELWLRAPDGGKKGWRRSKVSTGPVIRWVDHRSRRILNEAPTDEYILSGEDDRLDDEYRYWSFVETHPAHIALAPSARQEAADALHWSYTDRLLAHPQPVPPPFSQEECQELLRLLNESGNPMTSGYTRMIARILLRVAHWRQVHFRPHKPLPRDVSYPRQTRSTPIMRTVVEILIGILCLGIPFLFADRARYSGHLDVEGSHASQSSGPLFVIGACACLVSAIILSASVTLISLPGLDSIARIGGLVAITCSVLSMITSFISIFRYKSEMARGVVGQSAGEGFVMLSRRSIMLSLPLVFLAYSVAGFITGIVIYSFRSATINLANAGSSSLKFEEYTRHMVLGVAGALAGVLIASAVAERR
ncbi:hypothetical protein F5I97DRAFT_812378 [Phlebopus sp. FC_14]|nr:hypothetical protein F5I97DRAFT_812378 [Phlebopus sp. FC_14]